MKKSKPIQRRKFILIIFTVLLSFAGISYSYWIDNLNWNMTFSTGKVDAAFTDTTVIQNELYSIDADTNTDGDILIISGEVKKGSSASVATIEYDIYNDSTMPIRYQTVTLPSGISLMQNETRIEPEETLRGNSLTIDLEQLDEYEFEFTIPFVQYNYNLGNGWKEDLTISVEIKEIELAEELVVPEISKLAVEVDPELKDVPLDLIGPDAIKFLKEVVPKEETSEKEVAPEVEPAPDTAPADGMDAQTQFNGPDAENIENTEDGEDGEDGGIGEE